MRKNYLKPVIETAPLLLNVGIMSAPGENNKEDVINPGASGPPQLPKKVF